MEEACEGREFRRQVLKQWARRNKAEGEDQVSKLVERLVSSSSEFAALPAGKQAARKKTVRKQLFRWTFLAKGRHACLSFLRLHDDDADEPDRRAMRKARRRTAFFCTIGPPLLDWWVRELNTRSRPAKALRILPQADRLWECVLAAARRGDGGPTATVLLRCLKLSVIHESAPPRPLECRALLQHHNPSIVVGCLELLRACVHIHEDFAVDPAKLVSLLARPEREVCDATLDLLHSSAIDLRTEADMRKQLWSLATGHAETSLRIKALSALERYATDMELRALAKHLETETNEAVVIKAISFLEPADLDIEFDRQMVAALAKHALSSQPGVLSLADLAIKFISSRHEVFRPFLDSLPLELQERIAASEDRSSSSTTPACWKSSKQACVVACLARTMDNDPKAPVMVLQIIRPWLVHDTAWQYREAGLLLLGKATDFFDTELGDPVDVYHLPFVVQSLDDSSPRVRRAGCVAAKKCAEMFPDPDAVLVKLTGLLAAEDDAAITKSAVGAVNRFLNYVSGLRRTSVEAALEGCIASLGHAASQIQRQAALSEHVLWKALRVLGKEMRKDRQPAHLVDMLAHQIATLCSALSIEMFEDILGPMSPLLDLLTAEYAIPAVRPILDQLLPPIIEVCKRGKPHLRSALYQFVGKLAVRQEYAAELRPWVKRLSFAIAAPYVPSDADPHGVPLRHWREVVPLGLLHSNRVDYDFLRLLPTIDHNRWEDFAYQRGSLPVAVAEGLANLMLTLVRDYSASPEARSLTDRVHMALTLTITLSQAYPDYALLGLDHQDRPLRDRASAAMCALLDPNDVAVSYPADVRRTLLHRAYDLQRLEFAFDNLLPDDHPLGPYHRRRIAPAVSFIRAV